MKLINTTEAVNHVLCHDLTQIIKGVTKDARFRKGHIVAEEDIPVLLSMGKEHLYVWEKEEGFIHENEAAEYLRIICQGKNMHSTEVKEGKVEMIADCDGILHIDIDKLNAVNNIDDIIIATRPSNIPIKKGDKLAGTRIIPLIIEEKVMKHAKQIAGEKPLLNVYPYQLKTVGLITTGNEISKGIIKDTFTDVIIEKLALYGMRVTEHAYPGDDMKAITKAVLDFKNKGVDLILCTGGMSVDPDDRTPGAIRATGANIITYGAPVLPGAMFLLGYFEDNTPVMGLPGCVMYAHKTIFDLVLPRVAAKIPVTKKELKRLGYGGLCLNCPVCHYPNCSFGKGV